MAKSEHEGVMVVDRQTKKAADRIGAALRGLDDTTVYSLLSGCLHKYLDTVESDASVNLLLLFTITHVMENRAARAEGRDPNFHTVHQLSRWTEMRRDEGGVYFSVTLSARMDHPQWDAAHKAAERAQGGFFPRPKS
jgi:hypothetical protein